MYALLNTFVTLELDVASTRLLSAALSAVGGGTIVHYRDVQAVAGGGRRLGDDQGAVGPHHLLHTHIGADCGGV